MAYESNCLVDFCLNEIKLTWIFEWLVNNRPVCSLTNINLIGRIPVTFMLGLCVELKTIFSGFLKVTLVARIFDTFLFWHYMRLKTFLSWLHDTYTWTCMWKLRFSFLVTWKSSLTPRMFGKLIFWLFEKIKTVITDNHTGYKNWLHVLTICF